MTHCLITGASRGIGRELALQALARGWQVTAIARGPVDLPGAQVLVLDVTGDLSALAGLAPLDILINNAGINPPARQEVLDMDPAVFAQVMAVNALAPLRVAEAALPALRAAGGGRVLSVSSQMSWMGYRKADQIAYRASKAALNKLMQGLATTLEPEGIAVALVDPGWVRTDMGGPGADLEAAPVAAGILDLAAVLSLAETGRFFRHDGTERPF